MIPVVPGYVELITLTTNLVIGVSVWSIVSSAAGRSGLPAAIQRKVQGGTAVFLGTWLGAALLLAPPVDSLVGQDPLYISPLVPLFVIVPFTIAILAIQFSPPIRSVLSATSLPAVIGVQLYRTIGALFLVLLALGQLPAHFALPAGWGDIGIGLSAPLVALAVARGSPGSRALAVAWNVVGLIDLVVAVGMGTGFLAPLLAPELGTRVPPAAVMGVFPMILVPTFAVPVSVLLHLLALARVRREERHPSASSALVTPG